MRISDWSSDVCSSDLGLAGMTCGCTGRGAGCTPQGSGCLICCDHAGPVARTSAHAKSSGDRCAMRISCAFMTRQAWPPSNAWAMKGMRSEEHTSELQSLMRISYAVFCLKKKKQKNNLHQ